MVKDAGDPRFFGVGRWWEPLPLLALRKHKGMNLFMNEYVDKVSNLFEMSESFKLIFRGCGLTGFYAERARKKGILEFCSDLLCFLILSKSLKLKRLMFNDVL